VNSLNIERGRGKSSPWRRVLLWAASLYPAFLLILTAANLFFPQRSGPLAFTQIFAPYFFLPLLAIVPFAFMRRALPLRLLLVACALVWAVRFLPPVERARAATPGADQISVISWNIRIYNPYLSQISDYLATGPADVVALHEAHGAWPGNDERLARVYPYRLLYPEGCPPGSALLSKLPILEHSVFNGDQPNDLIPRGCWARLDTGNGESVTIIAAHPYPPSGNCRLPVCVDPSRRDAQIARIREGGSVNAFLEEGRHFLLVGDFNVTDREPAYRELSAGLHDAHLEVGAGAGSTWAPLTFMRRGIPLIRIDYLFSSPTVTPLTMKVDCTPLGSDHCMLFGTFELPKQ
jgi:endonuclease/exonuclease/phosphatase family metal-dependent hydrolase